MTAKITIEVEGQECVIFCLDEFQIQQDRDISPVYTDDWGKIRAFVENPANPGVKVVFSGRRYDPSKT
jgi:hypothetical protein